MKQKNGSCLNQIETKFESVWLESESLEKNVFNKGVRLGWLSLEISV